MAYRSYVSKRRADARRAALLTAGAYVGIGGAGIATLAMYALVQAAVMVAHGYKMHIGADILLAGYTTAQLGISAAYAGTLAVISAASAIVCAIFAAER